MCKLNNIRLYKIVVMEVLVRNLLEWGTCTERVSTRGRKGLS